MVRVKAPKKDNTFFTPAKHFLVMIGVFGMIGLGVVLLKFHRQESRAFQLRTGGGMGMGMVDAHSAKYLVNKPHLVYGTAWKKDDTAKYVHDAIQAGFRFIDTACQPKHYNEKGVGFGWTSAAQELGLTRADLWIQTKFTPYSGQDPNNVPYDKHAPVADQARTSLEVSLRNLQTDYLDSWVLHSPMEHFEDTMKVWRVMEDAVDSGKTHQIGISNCYDMDVFRALYQQARVKPAVVQNRFYAETDFDTELRIFCKDRNIKYQSFWTLTANRKALASPKVIELASAKGLTAQTYMYAFLMSLGYVTPLSGTTSIQHMAQDVAVMERMQGGEELFTVTEQKEMAALLGMPGL
ncbi:aldo/keto reductase [Nitzschia inconspicua]|uniref:Aldo/keto reductase n=1 Tax=Nitzschia inconspicua TaxID=303405 RepID=A0A9K3LWD6_9STRA|nr:aldo/keto reductase [Nitzschia inconspicua]